MATYAYKSLDPKWQAAQKAKSVLNRQPTAKVTLPTLKTTVTGTPVTKLTPAQIQTQSAGISRGVEANMEVGDHSGVFQNADGTSKNTSTGGTKMIGTSWGTPTSASPIQTSSSMLNLTTSKYKSQSPTWYSDQAKRLKEYQTSIKKEKELKEKVLKPEVVKPEVTPMEGFTFIGYDEQGRPKYQNNKEVFREQNPWYDQNGDFNKNWTPTSEEDVVNNISDPYAQAYYISKLKGYDVSNMPISTDEFEKQQELFRTEEKSLLEQQISKATEKAQKQSKEQQASVQASLAQGREGVMSEGNKLAVKNITDTISKETGEYIDSLNRQKIELEQLQSQQRQEYSATRADRILTLQAEVQTQQAALEEAQAKRMDQSLSLLNVMKDTGALANLSEDDIAYLQEGMPGLPGGILQSISNAETRKVLSETQQQQFDNQSKVVGTIKELVGMGIELSPEMMMNYSEQTGLPFESIYGFNQAAQNIMADKNLDTATKKANLMKLGYELDDLSKGIVGQQLKNVEYIKNMYANGASADEIAFVKNALGIKDMDDPMYRAELTGKLLQNEASTIANAYLPAEKQLNFENATLENTIKQLDSLMKSEDWKNYPEKIKLELEQTRLDMKKANEEIKKTFGTPVYVNQTGKFGINQTTDGIQVDVKSGELGGQCGRFVNNYLGEKVMADSYKDKLAITDPNITEGSPGMVFVMPLTGEYAKYGHTGIIEKVYYDAQGRKMYDVVDSNWGKDEKIKRHTIAADRVSGYLIPDNATSANVKAPSTYAEKLTAMENRLPDAYKWIGTSMQVAYPDKADSQLENVVSLIDQGRGQEAKTLVYTAIMNKAPADKVANLKDTIDSFKALDDEFQKFSEFAKTKGYKPDVTTSYMNDLNTWMKKNRPAEYVAFERRVNEAFAAYLKSLSGTAVSEQEANRIRKLFGDPDKPILENQISMAQLKEGAMREMNNFVNAYSNGQFTSYQKLNEALDGISSLNAKDLTVSDYGLYKPGDIFTITKTDPESYSYTLDQSTNGSFDPTYLNRY